MAEAPLALLGGLGAAEFLARHWQREPLLVRQALPGFRSPLSPEELAGLACEEGIESRLVLERDGSRPWELRHGPFEARAFTRLPASHWTLLVQDLDKVVPELAALIDHFDFLPRWRVDDVMVSYAAPGGGVGAHLDSYDVFLLQGPGRRRWSISTAAHRDDDFLPDVDLRILRRFEPEASWVLEPGDMLYLPPGVAHEGVAVDACMTFSIGFRAPSQRDLLAAWLEHALPRLPPDRRYQDPGLAPAAEPGLITEEALAQVRALLRTRPPESGELAEWFGRLVTEPAPGHPLPRPRRAPGVATLLRRLAGGAGLAWHPACRVAHLHQGERCLLFAGGESWTLEPPLAAAGPTLTRGRRLPLATLRAMLHADAPLPRLLAELLGRGCLELR